MSKEVVLFNTDELTVLEKFYHLMDLLISNQSSSMGEAIIFLSIFYLQYITSFFDEKIGVFKGDLYFLDNILNYIKKIVRIKDLFSGQYSAFTALEIVFLVLLVLGIIDFLCVCFTLKKDSIYDLNKIIINLFLKFFIFVFYNVIFDFCFSNFCLGKSELNPNFKDETCSIKDHIGIFIISIILAVLTFVLYTFIQMYYSDAFYLNGSFYAKMSSNYEIYLSINSLILSLLLNQVKFLTKEFYMVYNVIISILLFAFYYTHMIYYDEIINIFVGMYHILYAWTSIFCLIFNFTDIGEKGIMYVISVILVIILYLNLNKKFENILYIETPFYDITNEYYLLKYFYNLIDKSAKINDPRNKSLLYGIIEMHKIECPNPLCISKTKERSYLPLSKKWSDPTKNFIEEEVYMKHLLIVIMNFFISKERCNADMYLNLSLYLLQVIGNYCQSLFFSRKVSTLHLSVKEAFTLKRLNIKLSKGLVEPLKSPKEQCVSLEGLNVSMYYKYDFLSQKFVDEISKDVNLSLDFWKTFRTSLRDPTKKIDFNIIFELTDKIRNTKANVELMWNKLLGIYSGSNSFFDLYLEYVEEINDDELKKRDLESLKRKNENFGDHIGQNYYSILFNKETVILIVNGDKGNEGTIELTNKEIERVFNYRPIDIKGMNLTSLMPKLFAKKHSKYIERYFKVGEKKIVDKGDYKTYGKDKNNSIIKLKLAVKLFPILNEKILFCGLINKENLDDLIIMDEKFNIQGMSSKLMKILNIGNKNLFQENEIPFYTICKKFIDFYNIFLSDKNSEEDEQDLDESLDENEKKKKEGKKAEKKDGINDNVEINENVELEYEIKLPQFLIDYADKTNRKNKEGIVGTEEKADEDDDDDDNKKEEIIEEYDENDLLLGNSEEKEDKHISTNDETKSRLTSKRLSKIYNNQISNYNTPNPTPNPTPSGTPTGTPTPGLTPNSELHMQSSKFLIKEEKDNSHQSEEEKIYRQKIKEYKNLFNTGKFSELETLIDNCNKDSFSNEYKFNFTFDRMKFGENDVVYIVRCIDNKNELGSNEQESAEEFDLKTVKYKKDKFEAIKPLYELYPEEKKEIIELPEKFLKLSIENKKFQKLLQACKIDIITMSKTHGEKKDEILEDENSSQTSQTGFDSGLVKKNRIEEIRRNLLTNVSNFFSLRYLRISSILLGVGTTIFIVLYAIFFNEINSNLENVSNININLFQSTFWTTQLLSILISLRTLYLKEKVDHLDYTFRNYVSPTTGVSDNKSYYNLMKIFAINLYGRISDIYGELEMDVPKYLSENDLLEKYWGEIPISFFVQLKTEAKEAFPSSISQLLSNSFSFLQDENYDITDNSTIENDQEEYEYFRYVTHLLIENAYDHILPTLYDKLIDFPKILSKFNEDQKDTILIAIIIYAIFIILICASFFSLIHLTNKSMTAGLEKLTKIRLERIEETIKKIETFNSNLKKFRDRDSTGGNENKDNEESQKQVNKQPITTVPTNKSNNAIKKKGTPDISAAINSNGFNTDVKKYIPLNVLNSSFIHGVIIFAILCLFLIPTFIYSNEMISNSNQLLLVENYIFGRLIVAGSEIVEIKCFMSDCNNTVELNYDKLVDMDQIQEVIKGINLFDEVNDFYNNKFLLDACAAHLDGGKNSPRYEGCLEQTLVQSANNTDNLIKLINDYMENIYKEYEMEKNIEGYYKQKLFGEEYFSIMEEIFYLYILPVGTVFADIVKNDFNSFLKYEKSLIIVFITCLELIMIVYCFYLMIFFVKKLVNYLSVSRCIMKIIPTSVIISTQELETWIENKY